MKSFYTKLSTTIFPYTALFIFSKYYSPSKRRPIQNSLIAIYLLCFGCVIKAGIIERSFVQLYSCFTLLQTSLPVR
ncbi:hypothetical protein FKM82_029204 [Ascaphus truei]